MIQEAGSILDTGLSSRYLGGKRGVHVYLPSSYRVQPLRHYPVLYLHDGQNVFSSAGPDIAFGWGSWELDRTADALCRAGGLQEIIMVAVDNSSRRLEEYNGSRHLPGKPGARTAFESYEAFLISELKPRMDQKYRTLHEAAHTAVMGSSMGGLCSLVLAWYHPEVFGSAASLSGAFLGEFSDFQEVLRNYHGPRKPFRVYLDSGVLGSMGGDDGCSQTKQVAAELRRIGWTKSDLRWFVDRKIPTRAELAESGLRQNKWAEARTSQHNEFYWRRRSWRALTFLFPPIRD